MNEIWTWKYPSDSPALRYRWLVPGALVVAALALVGWAILGSASGRSTSIRYLLVMALMLLALAIMAEIDSRRALSTSISVDRGGLLTFSSGGDTTSFSLAEASEPSFRMRSHSVRFVSRWSLETLTPQGPWHREIMTVAGYSNLDENEIRGIESEIQRLHRRFTHQGQTDPTSMTADPHDGETPAMAVETVERAAVASTAAGSDSSFVWVTPEIPTAQRNRRRVRLGFGLAALAVAVLAAASSWKDGPGAVALSMFVPVLLLLIGLGLDRMYVVGRGFRLTADRTGVQARKRSKVLLDTPRDRISSVTVSTTSGAVYASGIWTKTTVWWLKVGTTDGETEEVALPTNGWGLKFGIDDAVEIETRLKQVLDL